MRDFLTWLLFATALFMAAVVPLEAISAPPMAAFVVGVIWSEIANKAFGRWWAE